MKSIFWLVALFGICCLLPRTARTAFSEENTVTAAPAASGESAPASGRKDCIQRGLVRAQAHPEEQVFFCSYQSGKGWQTEVFEAQGDNAVETPDYDHYCNGPISYYQSKAGKRAYLVLECSWTDAFDSSHAWVNTFVSGQRESYSARVECTCALVEIRDMKLQDDGKTVIFTVFTYGEQLTIEGRPLDIPRDPKLRDNLEQIARVEVKFTNDGQYLSHRVVARLQ